MSSALPLRIDPLRLVEQRVRLRGTLSLARMKRLGKSLIVADGIIHVSLRFGRNTGGLKVIAGEIETQLEMECQRCLKPFMQNVDRRFELALVQSEDEANRLLAEYEVLEVGGADIFTQDLVEDELLLSIPLIPTHADMSACDAVTSSEQTAHAAVPEAVNEENSARNPFSKLKNLKTS